MNIAQIEINLQKLIANINKETFIFDLLLAYGLPKASITRLQKGNLNMSKTEGEISWKKKLFFRKEQNADLHLTVSELAKSITHKERFVIVTDYKTLLAIDTKTDDKLDCAITDLPKHYDFFLPWAGMEKAQHQDENPAKAEMMQKKKNSDIVRSSAAEYLTFIAAHGEGGVEAVYADENVWLTQKMMGTLYHIETHTINYHLKKIFTDNELQEDSVIRNFRITASDGKNYTTKHYNLSAIIAVGYKVNSERAVQFRKWATGIIREFTIKGFTMDDERLKNDGTILGKKYFEEQLQRIREIRLSERKFYQKITDIYATAIDYDITAQATKRLILRNPII